MHLEPHPHLALLLCIRIEMPCFVFVELNWRLSLPVFILSIPRAGSLTHTCKVNCAQTQQVAPWRSLFHFFPPPLCAQPSIAYSSPVCLFFPSQFPPFNSLLPSICAAVFFYLYLFLPHAPAPFFPLSSPLNLSSPDRDIPLILFVVAVVNRRLRSRMRACLRLRFPVYV